MRSLAAELRPVSITEAREMRDKILRKELPPGGSIYPQDDAAETLHLGAFVDNELAAVATICQEALPGISEIAWRLRGMATLPERQGSGLGKQLTLACMEHALTRKGKIIWCSARNTVLPFYKALGFHEHGEPFTLPQYSDYSYIIMYKALENSISDAAHTLK